MAIVFIDRDGTINEDKGFTHKNEELVFLPGVLDGLKLLRKEGFGLVIFTNQSGINRGLFTAEEFQGFMQGMANKLRTENIKIDEVLFCPHTPEEGCSCRKPSPMLIEKYAAEHKIDLSDCFVIGDRIIDVQAGINAGCLSVLINNNSTNNNTTDNKQPVFPDFVANDLLDAAEWIVTVHKTIKNRQV